jgi:excisionase family DNA binding protein
MDAEHQVSKIIDIQAAAELLAVDYKTVYRLIQSGQLPAAKIGRVYRLAQDDVERYFENRKAATMRELRQNGQRDRRAESPAAVEVAPERRCSWCGRALVLNYSVAAQCREPGCEAVICRDCSLDGQAAFCPLHAQPADRNEQVERLRAEGRLAVSDDELRTLAAAYLDQVAERIQALSGWPLDDDRFLPRAELSVTVQRPAAEEWLGLGSGNAVPLEAAVVRRGRIRTGKALLHLALVPALHRAAYERYGFDVQPLTALDARSLLDRLAAPRRNASERVVALWSPTGWTTQAVGHAGAGQHAGGRIVLVDRTAGSCTGADGLLEYLLGPSPDEPVLDDCARFARNELAARSSVRLDTLVEDGGFHREIARRCLERMAAGGDHTLDEFDDLGLVLSRR